MLAKVKYAIFVKEDILESVNWHNQAQESLGKRFLKEVKETNNHIAKNPEKNSSKISRYSNCSV